MVSPCLLAASMLSVLTVANVIDPPGKNFDLLILHNNDMHARFEQTSQHGGVCTPADEAKQACYGGFARIAHVVKKAREEASRGEGPPVLFLNAGDTYTGTAWFSLYKAQIAAEFVNALAPDAISFGNHEFDFGLDELAPFLENLTCPVIATNIDTANEPKMANIKNVIKSYIFTKGDLRIGVIGYLTPETYKLTIINMAINISNEIDALKKEAVKLKSEGVNILIALGHSGYLMDQEIAKHVPYIDLVIGGHSHTFLWTGKQPDVEVSLGPYPTIVRSTTKRKVLVVQSYAFTKYLGKLRLSFNLEGEITSYSGEPILLDNSVPEDESVLNLLNNHRSAVSKITNVVIGRSAVNLDGMCRLSECNLGNLVVDAIIDYYISQYFDSSKTDCAIAIFHSGGIRASIQSFLLPNNITKGDLMNVLPYEENIIKVKISGSLLKEIIEFSVKGYNKLEGHGKFLQFSGIMVTYNLNNPPGNQVININVLCIECKIPHYKPLNQTKTYNILVPAYLSLGGDGYDMLPNLESNFLNFTPVLALESYITKLHLVHPMTENRIVFIDTNSALILKSNKIFISAFMLLVLVYK